MLKTEIVNLLQENRLVYSENALLETEKSISDFFDSLLFIQAIVFLEDYYKISFKEEHLLMDKYLNFVDFINVVINRINCKNENL